MATSREKLQLEVNARDRASSTLKKVAGSVAGIATAYIGLREAIDLATESFTIFADYEANLKSLEKVVGTTGRSMVDVYAAMESQVGGLASKASIASGFLKGMTTTLTVEQINNLTSAMRNATIAMGESFEEQFPLIIKAIKQLNPAILDNIGVTVRLDQVNKKITEGFYGAGTAINEVTQQHAIYTEIMRQTAQFQGLEAELMDTTKGKIQALKVAWTDLQITIGKFVAGPTMELLAAGESIVRYFGEGIPLAIDMTIIHLDKFISDIKEVYYSIQSQLMGGLSKLYELGGKDYIAVGMKALAESAEAAAENIDKISGTQFELNLQAMADKYLEFVTGVKVNTPPAGFLPTTDEAITQINEYFETIKGPYLDGLAIINEEERTGRQEHFVSLYELEQDESDKRFDVLNTGLQKRLTAYDENVKQRQQAEAQFDSFFMSKTQQMTGGFVDLAFGMRTDFQMVLKGMAADVVKFLLNQILLDAAGFFAGGGPFLSLFKWFDVSANDRMLMNEGRRAAMFFREGMEDGLSGIDTQIISNISSGAQVNSRALEKQIFTGESLLVRQEGNLTGQPDVRFN
ncbi:MAG: hypothetical protein PVJ60_00635 [Phycisphaerales bacterium]|jgi:hypothetical protein